MTALPRVVLKWLQSLDLSFSVRNVRRDLSNGFTIAEVLSRYYPCDVAMHSLQNANGKPQKIQNWKIIRKLLEKCQFKFTPEEIEEIIVGRKREPVVMFVCRLYEKLTDQVLETLPAPAVLASEQTRSKNSKSSEIHRKTKTESRKRLGESLGWTDSKEALLLPQYALPTATQTLKSKQRELESVTDETSLKAKRSAIIQKHRESMHEYKLWCLTHQIDGLTHFGHTGRTKRKSHVRSKGINAVPQTEIGFDSDINQTLIPQRRSISQILVNVLLQGYDHGLAAVDTAGLASDWLTELCEVLKHSDESESDENKVVRMLQGALEAGICAELADSALNNPREYWTLISTVCAVIEQLSVETEVYYEWITLSQKVFEELHLQSQNPDGNPAASESQIRKKGEYGWQLFVEFGLKRMIDLILASEMSSLLPNPQAIHSLRGDTALSVASGAIHKRLDVLRIICELIDDSDDRHLQLLKSLQSVIQSNGATSELSNPLAHSPTLDVSDFIVICACLGSLFDFDYLNDTLLDIYTYYAMTGNRHVSPKVRAASLSLICHIFQTTRVTPDADSIAASAESAASFRQQIITGMVCDFWQTTMEPLQSSFSELWWECQIQSVNLCCIFLEKYPPSVVEEESANPPGKSTQDTLDILTRENQVKVRKTLHSVYQFISNLITDASVLKSLNSKVIKYTLCRLSSVVSQHLSLHQSFFQLCKITESDGLITEVSKPDFVSDVSLSFGVQYHLESFKMPSLIIWQQIAEELKQYSSENLTSEQFHLLELSPIHEGDTSNDSWEVMLDELCCHMCAELCDIGHCLSAVGILNRLMDHSAVGDKTIRKLFWVNPPRGDGSDEKQADCEGSLGGLLFGVLTALFPAGAPECQSIVVDWLSQLRLQPEMTETVNLLIQSFQNNFPMQCDQSSKFSSLL